jgi:predicted RecA/RadA family phage recombinase
MITQGAFYKDGTVVDYTAAADIVAGAPIKAAGLAGIAVTDIANGAAGSVRVAGIVKLRKKEEAIVAGLPIWWDANGNPYIGTAGTGAATSLGGAAMAAGDILMGAAVADAATTDDYVLVALNQFSPNYPAWPNRYHKADTTGTLDANDSGMVLRIATADQTITLPEIATVHIGMEVIIIADTADAAGSTGLIVAPNANDGFSGFGITHAVNKSLTNTEATAKRGDYLRLLSAGDTHWRVLEMRGTWARAS